MVFRGIIRNMPNEKPQLPIGVMCLIVGIGLGLNKIILGDELSSLSFILSRTTILKLAATYNWSIGLFLSLGLFLIFTSVINKITGWFCLVFGLAFAACLYFLIVQILS
jgi:hypothetical protein